MELKQWYPGWEEQRQRCWESTKRHGHGNGKNFGGILKWFEQYLTVYISILIRSMEPGNDWPKPDQHRKVRLMISIFSGLRYLFLIPPPRRWSFIRLGHVYDTDWVHTRERERETREIVTSNDQEKWQNLDLRWIINLGIYFLVFLLTSF